MQWLLLKLIAVECFTRKRIGGDRGRGFSKNVFSRERTKTCYFVIFNIIKSHIFPENVIEIPQIFQKIWKFYSSMLIILTNFSACLRSPYCKETNDASIKQTTWAFLYLQPTLNRLFNDCKKLYWYLISSTWNIKEGQIDPPLAPSNKKPPSKSPALVGLNFWLKNL